MSNEETLTPEVIKPKKPYKQVGIIGGSPMVNLAVAAAVGMPVFPIYAHPEDQPRELLNFLPRKRQKIPQPCGLLGCANTTTHNGGYCCPDHCKQHKKSKQHCS